MDLNFLKSKLQARRDSTNEEGFTLIELMAVIIVLAVLVAILIPVFANQQKSSMESTLRTDIRQAALVMHTESTKQAGRFLSYLPSFATKSANNKVTLETARSSTSSFCLSGINSKLDDVVLYYSSKTGKISSTPCAVISSGTGGTFANETSYEVSLKAKIANKKAISIAKADEPSINVGANKVNLQNLGYGQVDIVSEAQFVSTDLSQYDFIYVNYKYWGPSQDVLNKTYAAYQGGAKVFMDGNDTTVAQFSTKSVKTVSNTNYLNPTYKQGLSPSFPYTFNTIGWGSDSWQCMTGMKNGAVALATTDNPSDPNEDCITMFGATNSNGGRWVYMGIGDEATVRGSAWQWLIS